MSRVNLPKPALLTGFFVVLLFADGGYHCACALDEETGPVERKADSFIREGAEFTGDTIVKSKNDVIARLGKPLRIESEKALNPHNDVLDTIYKLYYEGLYLEIYELNLHERSYVIDIVLESKSYKVKWDLGVGSTKERIEMVLDTPDESDDLCWTYVPSNGYPAFVKFWFAENVVQRIEWSHGLD